MHVKGLRKRQCFPHKPTQVLTQGIVPAFDMIGLTTGLAHRTVLFLINNRCIGLPEIGITGPYLKAFRDAIPKATTSDLTSITHGVSDDLTGVTAQHDPHPDLIRFAENK